ncbi:hypothetical protein GCM10022243_36430 [Saccharothrix violaceirubra]|uniref:Putative membrane protein n=1 Tax=Saccharothrix violaceirubra TaxID=413306 RepID=A0A7W7T033_9PSEU|nr:hypothetical protein [Saccharothrix violaceirubra]MBB4964015.1 putative membrane protein [Saccharothrix violaceirubra]
MTKTWHRPTLWLAAVMAVLALGTAIGLLVDDRVLQGSPLWLKPFKFSVSLAIYSVTLSWMLSLPHRGRRITTALATLVVGIMAVEIAFIVASTWHGAFTHFNQSEDALNNALQFAFGFVMVMFAANIVLALVFTFQRAVDRPTMWAVRTGTWLAIAGMGIAYLMIFQFDQGTMATDAAGRTVELSSGHSVGVPDGGPGMPITGWSTMGGDLRVPHFVGLHGLQVMVLLLFGLTALKLTDRAKLRLVFIAAASYAGFLALLTWQALRGEPLVHPGFTTLAVAAGIAVATAAATVRVVKTGKAVPLPDRRPALQR